MVICVHRFIHRHRIWKQDIWGVYIHLFYYSFPTPYHLHTINLNLNNNLMRRVLLLRLTKDVNRPPRLVSNVRNVEAAGLLLANLLDLGEVVFRQINLLEVLLDARRGDGLGDDGVAANLGPGEDDLRGGGADAGGDLLDGGVLDEEGLADHVVAEGLWEC